MLVFAKSLLVINIYYENRAQGTAGKENINEYKNAQLYKPIQYTHIMQLIY